MADPGDEMIAIAGSSKPSPAAASSSSTPDAQDDLLDDGDEGLRRICDAYDRRIYGVLQADGFTASKFWANTSAATYVLLSDSIQKVLENKMLTVRLVNIIQMKLELKYDRVASRVLQTKRRDVQMQEWLKEKLKHLPGDKRLQRCLRDLNAKQAARNVDGDNAMASLKRTYAGNAHETMYEGLCRLSLDASMGSHYSCYSAIVQSSGTGKTRGVLEMSRLGVYVCYCSTAAATGSACPPRSGQLADELSKTFNEVEMALYFKAWLSVLVDEAINKNTSPQVWIDSQLGDTFSIKDSQLVDTCTIRNSVLGRWKQYSAETGLETRGQKDCDQRNLHLLEPELNELAKGLPAARSSVKVLLVFDEARGMLPGDSDASHLRDRGMIEDDSYLQNREQALVSSPFYQMRRVSRVFFSYKFCFSVCMDTSAKISNMHPTSSEEQSRNAKALGVKLLRPVYEVLNMQLVIPSEDLTPKEVFRIGRPMWSSRLDWETMESFLSFVERKLICVPYGTFSGDKVDIYGEDGRVLMAESQAIALLSVTAGLEICPRSVVSHLLVASHMGVVNFISPDGSRVHVSHAVEPAVSEAATRILNHRGGKPFVAAVEKLTHAFMNGYCGRGDRGEFVCKTLLLMAGWRLVKDQGLYLTPIPLRDYLVSLLGLSKDEVNRACDGLPEDSSVFFNSFMLVKEKQVVTEQILAAAYLRGCAIHFRAGNQVKAIDFYVPVSTSKGMTCIAGSAKNNGGKGNMRKEGTEDVNPVNMNLRVTKGLKVLTLLINVSEPDNSLSNPLPAAMLWKTSGLSARYRKTFDPKKVAHMSMFGLERNFRGFEFDKLKSRMELTDVEREAQNILMELLVSAPDTEKEARSVSQLAAEYVHKLIPDVSELQTPSYASLKKLARLTRARAELRSSHQDNRKVDDNSVSKLRKLLGKRKH